MGALDAKARDTVVLKFGSSVLTGVDALPDAVHEVYRALRDGQRVVAVVSALAGETDRLLAEARVVSDGEPDPAATARLLATGEARSVALLGAALARAGVPAQCLDEVQIGLRTEGPPLESSAVDLDADAVHAALDRCPVAVVPGFVGRDAAGRTTVLGRGGSDLTALFIAQRLGARCRLVKDTAGLFERDPATVRAGETLRRYRTIRHDDALRLGGGVVQQKAIRFARETGFLFEVGCCHAPGVTTVGADASVLEVPDAGRPLRIGLIGLGTVGLGVYRALRRLPGQVEIVGVAVRDRARPRAADVDPRLLTDPESLLDRVDLLVEAAGGVEPVGAWVQAALDRGVAVVSANKALLAARAAGPTAAPLLGSAAVGGAAPLLEAARRLVGRVSRIDAVLNGTSGFVLDRLADGVGFEDAVHEAQARGLAEADPSDDLDGTDVARKLVLLARAAFGSETRLADVDVRGLDGTITPACGLRLVATAERTFEGLRLSVRPAHTPLPGLCGACCGARFELRDGGVFEATGTGAGRWPTTEAVVGDVLALARTVRAAQSRRAAA
ncbi:MAG: amino acid kinase family protein [Planctomycetota bacterium]|jgi:homoserine dehydrogenase